MSAHDLGPDIDEALVRRLLAGQFPQWADLALSQVIPAGTDNALYRLGDHLTVRLPARLAAAIQAERDQRWLPWLAPKLPLTIPAPIGAGVPAEGYPWAWSVCPWLPGEDAATASTLDLNEAAATLARFLVRLQSVDASSGPAAGPMNHSRGVPLSLLDERVRRDLEFLGKEIDRPAVLAIWRDALAAPSYEGPGSWVHGDLHPGNLLTRDGRIVGVLDFGLLGVGDPACDLLVAWSLLDASGRAVFQDVLRPDAASWSRGRGWAVFNAVIALAFYLESDTHLCRIGRNTLAELTSN